MPVEVLNSKSSFFGSEGSIPSQGTSKARILFLNSLRVFYGLLLLLKIKKNKFLLVCLPERSKIFDLLNQHASEFVGICECLIIKCIAKEIENLQLIN